MITELKSNAEKLAEKAENLKAFSGLKLLHVKKQVELILNQIGKNGIFEEYTKHDISHIDYMLESLDDIIPESTKPLLTSSDWLMITLSIYFHDLGMLVTKDEFNSRDKTSFPNFKETIINGEYGLDYRDKILGITNKDEQDRFIYQELVRKTHAERIKYWILGEKNASFSIELQAITEIHSLLHSVDNMFRRDLALVCESHHLSDLEDFEKYKTNQQYGPSKDEIVNLHYSALILRTADLLHITSDRTPSIEFNLINPSDPISQEEWAKQKAVKAVRPQSKKDKEGNINEQIPKDTFEVIALFEDEKGFFGLISYLNYADKQLKENYKYNELSKKLHATGFDYPWKNIDDSSIQAENFDKRQFEFVLDQTKILDLLVGHTLYNDHTVVLRELTQNSIDACRLKEHENNNSDYTPKINIEWKENEKELSFTDNGTGMTLEIIQNHLLKVGSSRYQDENFKKKYPNFSPISRFGIGLLTCFLIADDIDIITKSAENEKAILLKIKKVHGKYLLKYLSLDKIPEEIRNHGTTIKLFVRSDVNLKNIEADLKKWILIPNCELTLNDNGTSSKIGFKSPKDVLNYNLKTLGYDVNEKEIKIHEITKNGVTIAYALRYIEHWKEWVFLEATEFDATSFPVGTCIEGVRVDFRTPGFDGVGIFAIVNTVGKDAPKTNVARSNIEKTQESENLHYHIYELYLEHISGELQSLKKEGFSITWAANETNYLLNTFTTTVKGYNKPSVKLLNPNFFEKAMFNLENILIEQNENRILINLKKLHELKHFWTIDSASYTSANSLIKEVKSSNSSALALINTIFTSEDTNTAHIDNLLCNLRSNNITEKVIRNNFQVGTIKIIPEQRRLDLLWIQSPKKIWEEIIHSEDENRSSKWYIQIEDIEVINLKDQIAINTSNHMYILRGSELHTYLYKSITALTNTKEDRMVLGQIVSLFNSLFYYRNIDNIEEIVNARIDRSKNKDLIWSKIDKQELLATIIKTNFIKYDTTVWHRRDNFLF